MPFKEWPSILGIFWKASFQGLGKIPLFSEEILLLIRSWFSCPGLELQWQNGIWIKKQNTSGFSRLSQRGMQMFQPWLPFVLGSSRIWLAWKYTQEMLIELPKHNSQGTYYQRSWVNLTSCQSLHSSSKFVCLRNKFTWLISPKGKHLTFSHPPTPHLAGDCRPRLHILLDAGLYSTQLFLTVFLHCCL